MKKADKSGAMTALLVGDDEQGRISIKYLRDKKEQQLVDQDEVINILQKITGKM